MGKNYKERGAYDYLHGKQVNSNLLFRIFRKWKRHNWDVGEYRAERAKLKSEINLREMKNELNNL